MQLPNILSVAAGRTSRAALSAITAEKQPGNSVMRSEGHDSLDNKGST